MAFIERLQYFMEYFSINDNQLTVEAGLSVGLIGKAKKTGKAMNSSNIEKILCAYPELNADWLLTGRGDMLKTKRTTETKIFNDAPLESLKDTPFQRHKQLSEPINSESYHSEQVLVAHLDSKIKEKDSEIGNLREEIGRLKARIEELQRERDELPPIAPRYVHSLHKEAVET